MGQLPMHFPQEGPSACPDEEGIKTTYAIGRVGCHRSDRALALMKKGLRLLVGDVFHQTRKTERLP